VILLLERHLAELWCMINIPETPFIALVISTTKSYLPTRAVGGGLEPRSVVMIRETSTILMWDLSLEETGPQRHQERIHFMLCMATKGGVKGPLIKLYRAHHHHMLMDKVLID
jgi:hypothetical protein